MRTAMETAPANPPPVTVRDAVYDLMRRFGVTSGFRESGIYGTPDVPRLPQ
jgi:hypothetical protein